MLAACRARVGKAGEVMAGVRCKGVAAEIVQWPRRPRCELRKRQGATRAAVSTRAGQGRARAPALFSCRKKKRQVWRHHIVPVKSSLVYTPYKQRGITRIGIGTRFSVMCPPKHSLLG
jgi:hypothetical protein